MNSFFFHRPKKKAKSLFTRFLLNEIFKKGVSQSKRAHSFLFHHCYLWSTFRYKGRAEPKGDYNKNVQFGLNRALSFIWQLTHFACQNINSNRFTLKKSRPGIIDLGQSKHYSRVNLFRYAKKYLGCITRKRKEKLNFKGDFLRTLALSGWSR